MTTPDTPTDIPFPGLELLASLSLSIGNLTDELKAAGRREQQRLSRLPVYTPMNPAVSAIQAGTTDVKDFGTPQPGRKWELRLLFAVAAAGTNASTVTWMVGSMLGVAAPLNLARWQFASVPGFENFSGDQITVLPNEHLFAVLTNIPAASVIALGGAFDDLPMYAAAGTVASG